MIILRNIEIKISEMEKLAILIINMPLSCHDAISK